MTRVHIRWLIKRDVQEVLTIEDLSYDLLAWDRVSLIKNMQVRNRIGMVAEAGDKVVGYMVYQLNEDHVELLRLAVHPNWRREKVGTQLVWKILSKLTAHRRPRLLAFVRESQLPAQLLFRSQGLRATKVLRGFFRDTIEVPDQDGKTVLQEFLEDAYRMELPLLKGVQACRS
jgi:ribosomal-protein-alanine N-acetyltransferase